MQKLLLAMVTVIIAVPLYACATSSIPQAATPPEPSTTAIVSDLTTPLASNALTSTAGDASQTPLDLIPPSKEFLAERKYDFPEIPRVTCEGLKQMMDRGDSYILVDLRFPSIYDSKHLPGAINISFFPTPTLTQEQIDNLLLGLPKDKLIIFYCPCYGDEESAATVDKLIKMDASYATGNVKVLWKGFWRWVELGYPLEQ